MVFGEERLLVANAVTKDLATKLKVQRITERLKEPIKGVSLASWFYPEPATNPHFFEGAGMKPALTLEELASRMGQIAFRKHYKRNLDEWLNPYKTFAKLKRLGINAVKIPVPEDMMLPLNQGIKFYKTVHVSLDVEFMANGYQDGLAMLDKAFKAAEKYKIGVYISNYARESGRMPDVNNWLLGVSNIMRRYYKSSSFIGIDLVNQPKIDQNLLGLYWKKGYEIVRMYSKDCLIFISDR
jgi:aryl-phospho-beta-D-glucosidase BglC (GH1 family)